MFTKALGAVLTALLAIAVPVSAQNLNGREVARFRVKAFKEGQTNEALDTGGKPKPFFHPLSTPAGHCLSIFEPHDHPWHRGLWFTIKLINGENFSPEQELVRDLIAIVTVFSARLGGLRSYKQVLKAAALQKE